MSLDLTCAICLSFEHPMTDIRVVWGGGGGMAASCRANTTIVAQGQQVKNQCRICLSFCLSYRLCSCATDAFSSSWALVVCSPLLSCNAIELFSSNLCIRVALL